MYQCGNFLLRKIEEDDLTWLKNIKNNSWQFTHNTVFLNDNDQEKWFNNNSDLVLILESNTTSLFDVRLGFLKLSNLDNINRSVMVSWFIDDKQRSKGLGKILLSLLVDYCFLVLNLHRIDAEILDFNIASQKCAKSVGFSLEGIKRKAIYKNGKWIDSQVYAILREDYDKRKTL